eukprot:CAMPEP_0119352558 /NCGR_PEP_ID=MMETSP1334-20130426/1834_1 /TAXON_ID=127549 /ORGANISM="Calcidiscus leptoporus, Strain RCC1130" /LENGTH=89 /DNA_ID=CAMNT_0007365639 /DNA_START=445 /DNA_END=711 /DNA_ORIENTATION=+
MYSTCGLSHAAELGRGPGRGPAEHLVVKQLLESGGAMLPFKRPLAREKPRKDFVKLLAGVRDEVDCLHKAALVGVDVEPRLLAGEPIDA